MPHVFFGLTIAGAFALCAFRVLPSGEFVDIGKWVTILYAISSTMVAVVRHVWPRPGISSPSFDNLAVTDAQTFNSRAYFDDEMPQQGVSLQGGFGSLHDDVFSEPIGDGVPPNYTSMLRDRDAPPVTTDGADGSPVLVPPLDFDGVFGPKPPIPHDYNRRATISVPPVNRGLAERLGQTFRADVAAARDAGSLEEAEATRLIALSLAAETRAVARNPVVVLGDPPTKEELT